MLVLLRFLLVGWVLMVIMFLGMVGCWWCLGSCGLAHTTLLLALPAERVQQVLRLQVGSSERKVKIVFVISLDVSVISSN